MAREYFCAYHSMLNQFKGLSDAEFGRLIRAALQYSASGQAPALGGREAILWPSIEWQVDEQVRAYEEKCRKNAANIRSRWQKNKAENQGAGAAESYERIRPNTTVFKKNKIKNTPLTPQGAEVAAVMYDPGVAQVAQCWQQNMGVLSPALGEQIAAWVKMVEPGMVCAVIRYAVLAGKRDGRYIDSIIRNAADRNITTLSAWNAEQVERQNKNAPAAAPEQEVKRKWL